MSDQIVSSWVAAQQAFDSAALTADPNEPALAVTTISPQLDATRSLLAAMRSSGQIAKGEARYGIPKIVMMATGLASVESCVHDAEIVVSASTGTPVPGVSGSVAFELLTSTMELSGGGWKLMTQSVGVGQCSGI